MRKIICEVRLKNFIRGQNIDPQEYVLQGKKDEIKGKEVINMRCLLKNVYQGKKN